MFLNLGLRNKFAVRCIFQQTLITNCDADMSCFEGYNTAEIHIGFKFLPSPKVRQDFECTYRGYQIMGIHNQYGHYHRLGQVQELKVEPEPSICQIGRLGQLDLTCLLVQLLICHFCHLTVSQLGRLSLSVKCQSFLSFNCQSVRQGQVSLACLLEF